MLYAAQMRELLTPPKTIAIVGAKDKPGTAVNMVGQYLIDAGYTVIPVQPAQQEVWGLKSYPTLGDIPDAVDIVDVFRAPEHYAAHAREAAAMHPAPSVFWMPYAGADARHIAEEAGMQAVEDRCIKVTHYQLFKS